MAHVKIRPPGPPADWPDDRLKTFVDLGSVLHDGQTYDIIDGSRDKKGAVLIIDTGDDGPDLPAGTVTDLGPVES